MPKESFSEKRKFVRFLVSIPLKYAKLSIKPHIPAFTRDISAQGVGLITAEELPVGRSLSMCLSIADNGEEIPLEADVVWSKQNGVPNQFCSGLRIRGSQIKPIPLVLRTINSRF